MGRVTELDPIKVEKMFTQSRRQSELRCDRNGGGEIVFFRLRELEAFAVCFLSEAEGGGREGGRASE